MATFVIEMLTQVVVLCAAVALASAAVTIQGLDFDPKPEKYKDIEGCYIKDSDLVIPFGASYSSATGCMQYKCDKDTLSKYTCGVAVAVPPCELVEDEDKPYPDCCPRPDDSPACNARPASGVSDVVEPSSTNEEKSSSVKKNEDVVVADDTEYVA